MYGTLENGVLTFPPKAILLTTPSLWEATSYFKANTEMTRLLFPGAVSYDYSVAFEKSAPADGKVAITATLGSDVDKVKYAFFEGALSESLAAAKSGDIDAGTTPSEEITASGTITAVMEKDRYLTPSSATLMTRKATSRNTGTYRSVTSRPGRKTRRDERPHRAYVGERV